MGILRQRNWLCSGRIILGLLVVALLGLPMVQACSLSFQPASSGRQEATVGVEVGEQAAGVYQALLTHGVIVRPVAGYGMPCHLRVSVGLPEENDRFLDALAEALVSAGEGG